MKHPLSLRAGGCFFVFVEYGWGVGFIFDSFGCVKVFYRYDCELINM